MIYQTAGFEKKRDFFQNARGFYVIKTNICIGQRLGYHRSIKCDCKL